MPHFECRDGKMLIRSDPFTGNGSTIYLAKLSSTFAKCLADKRFTDVVLACKDGFLSAHAIVLANGSVWLKDYLEAITTYGVVDEIFLNCPDFSMCAMAKVMELFYTGVTYVEDRAAIGEIRDIVETLGLKADIILNSSEIETHSRETTEVKVLRKS